MSAPFVVVGGSLAGLRAAETARLSGYDGAIVMIGAEGHPPDDRPPLSIAFLDGEAAATLRREERQLREELGIQLRLGQPVTGLDPADHTVRVGDEWIEYGALVIATGSTPLLMPIGGELLGGALPVGALPGVHAVRTVGDAASIRAAVRTRARVVVVGAGLVGSEIAASARRSGSQVTLVEAAPVPLARVAGPVVGAALAGLHLRHGVDLRLGVSVVEIRGRDRVEAVVLSDGTIVPADVVAVAMGSRPATDWLAGSGIALDAVDGGVLCDPFLATSLPDVYAAGDVAHWPNPAFDFASMRLENWTGAGEQGGTAARNALGLGPPTRSATVPYVWSDWYDSRLHLVGYPAPDEVRVVSGDLDGPAFVALYRSGDQIAGAVSLNQPERIMQYRRLIRDHADWQTALDLSLARVEATA
jgi:NADPH-dependent 2,4-dienoyl-CoA reductase/sulfur reductase-like enzyme